MLNMGYPGEATFYTDVTAQALLMTPAVHRYETEHYSYSGAGAVAHLLRRNIGTAVQPYLAAAEGAPQEVAIRVDWQTLEDTVQAGFEDIETIFRLAGNALQDADVPLDAYEEILQRSGRLVIAASKLNNVELEALYTAIDAQRSYRGIPADAVRKPLELRDPNQPSLSWNGAILGWMRASKANGCPARSAIVPEQSPVRQTVM